jgi:hypothetical protein
MPERPLSAGGPQQTEEFIRPVHTQTVTLPAGTRKATFKIPPLPDGFYFADVKLLAGGVVHFALLDSFDRLPGEARVPLAAGAEYYRVLPHSMLRKGMSNLFWYLFCLGTEGCVSPSLDCYPQTQNAIAEVKWIKAGAGRLILTSRSAKRKIAILYSTPSHIFSFVASGPHLPWNFNSACSALHRLGYQTAVVSPSQVVAGALADYQVLLLPVTQCLSGEEAEKIRQFVAAGRLVIADVRPGVADAHGRFRKEAALADVFGARWNDPAAAPLRSLQLTAADKTPELSILVAIGGECNGIAFATPALDSLCFDPAVAPVAAKATVRCSLPAAPLPATATSSWTAATPSTTAAAPPGPSAAALAKA